MQRRGFLTRIAPIGLLALAGCSSDEPAATGTETTTATATDTPTPTPTATDTPTTTSTDDGDGGGGGYGGYGDDDTATAAQTATATDVAQTVTVAPNGDLEFSPASFTITAGDTVRWVWEESGHNVSPGSVPSGTGWDGRDGDVYSSGTTHTHTFETTGTYEYHCDPHESVDMVGSFTVE